MAGQYSEGARRTPIRDWGPELLLSGDVTLAWGLLFSAWGIVFLAAIRGADAAFITIR